MHLYRRIQQSLVLTVCKNLHYSSSLPVLFDLLRAGTVWTPNGEKNLSARDPSLSSFQHAMVTMVTHQPANKSRSRLEEMESEGKIDWDFKYFSNCHFQPVFMWNSFQTRVSC